MERENTQAVSPDISDVDVHDTRLPRQRVSTVPDDALAQQLQRLQARGWCILPDMVRPFEESDPVSYVLVGPTGVLIMETAAGFVRARRDAFLGGAGAVAATLPAAHRHHVRSLLVLSGQEIDSLAVCRAPAAIDTIAVEALADHLTLDVPVMGAQDISHIAAGITTTWSGRRGGLLTAEHLPPADECVTEAGIRARQVPRGRRRKHRDQTHTEGRSLVGRSLRRATSDGSHAARQELTLTDTLRIVLVTFAIVVGMWFATVLSDAITHPTGETARRTPVISSQPSGSSQTDAVALTGEAGPGSSTASR